MADIYDGLEMATGGAVAGPSRAQAAPAAPSAAPAGLYEGLQEVAPAAQPRTATGLIEHVQAGFQQSVAGLAWRRKLPELVMDPATANWLERLATGVTQVGADLSIMIPAGAVGGAKGAALGTPAGPGGALAGSLLVGGAAMFAAPAAIRESLIQAYKARDAQTPVEWLNALREVAAATAKEGAIGAVTMGAGGVAARAVGKAVAPAIGQTIAIPTEIGAKRAAAGVLGLATGGADVAAQIAAMVTAPALVQGHLPEAREFVDAAAVILTLKAGHTVVDRALRARTADRLANVYEKTGRTPAQQLADAVKDPKIAEDLTSIVPRGTSELTGTTSGVPVKLDRIIAEAEFLARGGVPEAPDIKQLIRELKAEGPLQGDMVKDIDRIGALYDQARQAPLTNPERAELEDLRLRVARAGGVEPTETTAMRYEPGQVAEAQTKARERLTALEKKDQLTDAERAERVMLTNAKPEAIAKHFGLEPARVIRVTPEAREESAQRIYNEFYRQARDADQARVDAGLQPLGDDHARAVALLVRRHAETIAASEGLLPEDVLRERQPQIRDETAAEVAAAEAAIPADAPRFEVPEVDLFGAPVNAPMVPRHLSENIPVQTLPVTSLKLSEDVPQFKKDANEKGVVQPLGGDPDPRGWAVQVWERLNGDLEVISGRHRLELWQRKGLAEIPAQIHREADGFTKDMAARLDAELNIRDEQGSIADYAQYFKDSGLSKEAADERGLLARYKGKTGFAIARDATPDLLAAHRAGRLSDEAALVISSAAPGSERLQALGMAMVNEGKSALIAVNTMKAVDLMAAERMAKGAQGDIFGFDDSAMREASIMAKRASSMQRKISDQISAVSGASKRPELAKKMGVDVQDPQGIQKRIVELRQEQILWDNWPLHPELVARLRGPEVTGREGDLKQGEVPPFYEETADGPVLKTTTVHLAAPTEMYKQGRTTYYDHMVTDPSGKRIGQVALGWRSGQIVAMVNIFADQQRAGIGETVLRAMIAHNKPETKIRIYEIQPEARTFWEKMGTELVTEKEKVHGTLTRASYERARGRSAVDERADQSDSGQAGNVSRKDDRGGSGDEGGGTLYQEDFQLRPETPAEARARDVEAAQATRRKIVSDETRGHALTPEEANAQFDLFSTQNELFQRRIPSEKELRERGEEVFSRMDAERRISDGERIFAGHDMDQERPIELTLDDIRAGTYAPDQMIALPPAVRYEVYNTRTGEIVGDYENAKRARRVADKKDLEYGAISYGTRPLNVLRQQERASYQIAERLITTMQGADKSSVVHELGHHFLENLKYYASRPGASERIKGMWETARHEFAIGEDGEIGRSSHETNAKSFERYLGEGEAPTPALRAVFEQFRTWMLEIYNDLRNIIGAKMNPEVKGLFDKMLATDQEIADARALDVPRAYVAEARATEAARIVPDPRKIEPGFKAEQVALEPYADELPKGPGEAPDNSHVNYEYVDGPTRIKLTLQRLAEIDQANVQKHRGGTEGVESWREEQATTERWMAETLNVGTDKLHILRGGPSDDPKTNHILRAKKQMMVGAGHESERLRDVVLEKGHNATIEDQLQYLSSIELLRQLHAEFLGERAAVARAMNALKDTTQGSAAVNSMLEALGRGNTLHQSPVEKAAADQATLKARLDEILLRYNGRSVLDIAKMHKEIGTLKGTFKLAEVLEKATTWEQVIEFWKSAGLLSGPVTQTTNFFGTGAFQVLRTPVDMLASVIGMARGASPGMGESDRASMSASVAGLASYLGAALDGLKVGYHVFKMDEPTGSKTDTYRTAIPGKFGEIVRIPYRFMGATDAMTSTMYKQKMLRQYAMLKAFDDGLSPSTREFGEAVERVRQNPPPDIELAATDMSRRMTFNAPLGEKGMALRMFINKWNLQWMIPFVSTPINITKELARMSPFAPLVGEWRADFAKGGAARDAALAEIVLGSGIMAITMAYTFSGDISGSGSPDPGKNRAKAGVRQPNSWKIGDTWYEYARIQPTGTLMGLAADLAEAWDHMTDEEKDKVPKMLARAFANAVTNQTFLQGITNVVNAMSDPTRFAPRFLQQLAGSMVPNIIGQPTAMADPTVRQVEGALQAIQARIPGLRQDLLPKRDWLGEDVKTKERLGVVGPVRVLPISDEKVRKEAARLDISIAEPPRKLHIGRGTGKLGDVELTQEERDKFSQTAGRMVHGILSKVVAQPGYDTIPDLVKKRIFQRALSAAHRVAAVDALPEEKRAAYLKQITEKVATELAPVTQ